jgi:hypothetical protein
MKIIKILITMTILNSFLVMGLVKYGASRPVPSSVPVSTTNALDNQTVFVKSPVPISTSTPKPAGTTTTPTLKPVATTTTATPKPTTAATATPTPTVAATPAATATPVATGCIVTINGSSYNITSLVKSHSGGNVFKCGTDMSSIFSGASPRHNISWMTRYKI